MVRVAFLGAEYSKRWMGGVNYISNLLFAISQLKDKKIEPIVFLGKDVDTQIYKKLEPYAKVVQDSLFDRKSVKWYIHKVLEKMFHITPLLYVILKKHHIDVISHSNVIDGCKGIVKINWIPDFQHVHLPEFFTKEENQKRDATFLEILKKSNAVVVSSHDAYEDTKVFAPQYIKKVSVLQFVSQPNKKVFLLKQEHLQVLEKKYTFTGSFFYLPNQFWKHKNHLSIFKAINVLKGQGINILLLCSGHMKDYRNPNYIDEIKAYIKTNNLEKNIRLLGLIDYDDVLYFMQNSVAVINPSLFEGWSSTVEECKSIGKNMILSDIAVHKEQNPPNSIYFDPSSINDIAFKLKFAWKNNKKNELNKNVLQENLLNRTTEYAINYQDIVLKAIKKLQEPDSGIVLKNYIELYEDILK